MAIIAIAKCFCLLCIYLILNTELIIYSQINNRVSRWKCREVPTTHKTFFTIRNLIWNIPSFLAILSLVRLRCSTLLSIFRTSQDVFSPLLHFSNKTDRSISISLRLRFLISYLLYVRVSRQHRKMHEMPRLYSKRDFYDQRARREKWVFAMLIIFTAALAGSRIVKQGVEVDELQFLSRTENGDWAQRR